MKQKIDAKKEKKNPNGNGCIETIWKCQTCHQVFSYRPMNCIKSKHLVGISRNLKKGPALTKNEERLNITRKSVEDGGLVLGAGLNWSGLKDGSDSE
jgi:minichromosome maintenance protein 10